MALREATRPALTPREEQVAALVAEGLTNREIAQRLGISERTADRHLENVREKLGVSSRARIASWYVEHSQGSPATELDIHDPEISLLAPAAEAATPPKDRLGRLNPRWLWVASGLMVVLLTASLAFRFVVLPRLAPSPVFQPIRTYAGTGGAAVSTDGKRPAATELFGPSAVAVDPRDGTVYFADGNRIRDVGPSGVVATVAGTGGVGYAGDGGSGQEAELNLGITFGVESLYDTAETGGMAVDFNGNVLFPDPYNDRIRLVTPLDSISTFAGGGAPPGHLFISGPGFAVGDGGLATASVLTDPRACAVDGFGNVYIADTIDNRIRRVDAHGYISTVAGTGTAGFSGDGGTATSAELNAPEGVAVGPDGTLFIADTGNQRIRRVDPTNDVITTIAGNGEEGYGGDGAKGPGAMLDVPLGLALDLNGNLYVADSGNNRVRKVDQADVITTVAGTGVRGFGGDGGPAAKAELAAPSALAVDAADNLYIADFLNNRIRVVALGQRSR